MKLFVFDTETSSLIKKETHNECYMLQFSYIIYDIDTKKIEENDFILKCPLTITNSEIHGITDEISERGYEFKDIADIILEDMKGCDLLIAHNITYDLNVLENELNRIGRYDDVDMIYNKRYLDTMFLGKMILRLRKFPKLIELYKHYNDGKEFDGQHNAIEDVRATLNCYLKMKEF